MLPFSSLPAPDAIPALSGDKGFEQSGLQWPIVGELQCIWGMLFGGGYSLTFL